MGNSHSKLKYDYGKSSCSADESEDSDSSDEGENPSGSNGTLQPSGTEKLAHDLKRLLLSGKNSDVTIRVRGRFFAAHRNILEVRTPVFSFMFRHEMKEKATGIIDIDDCEADVFGIFLRFVYTGLVEGLTGENVFDLYKVALKYQVDELKAECVECMKTILSVDSFCDVVTFAVRHGERELMKSASDFFTNRIAPTAEWQRFIDQNSAQTNEQCSRYFG